MVFQQFTAKVAISFSSSVKTFENTAFSHMNEMPNQLSQAFDHNFFTIEVFIDLRKVFETAD